MRDILTGLAILVCLALIGAMTAPYFIDWTQHRALFEQKLADMTGHRVRIEGHIALTLLPTPSLAVERLRLGPEDASGLPMLEAERVAASLQATALLRGDIVITEAHIDRPVLRIGSAGRLAPDARAPRRMGDPDAISIQRLQVYDGALHITRPGQPALLITEINGDGEATSLIGPAQGNASFVMDGTSRHIRLALGRFEDGRARIKALYEDVQRAARLDLDGSVEATDSTPVFTGTAALTANPVLLPRDKVQLPVRATAQVKTAGNRIQLDDIALTLGSDPRPLSLAGTGTLRLESRPLVDLTLSGRSYDFDWPGPDGKPRHAVPAALLRQLSDITATATPGGPGFDGRLDLSLGGIIIGGQTLIGARLVAERQEGVTRILELQGEMPGQSQVRFRNGEGSGPGLLSGMVEFSSRDPEKLHGWFHGIQRTITAAASISARATLGSVAGGIDITAMEIERGATRFTGTGSYRLAQPGLRPAPRLTLQLASPRLAIEDIPAYAFGGETKEEKPDLDFEVDLTAGKLVHEGRETGRLVARVRRDGTITSIERVAISELDGASLIASGTLGGGARRVTIKLDAERMGGIAAMAEQVFPGGLSTAIRRRAAVLSPALVVATLANEEADGLYTLSAEGRLAATDLTLDGRVATRGDIDVNLALTLRNPDSAGLIRQLVPAPSDVRLSQPGEMRLALKGNPRAAMGLTLDAILAGATTRVSGDIRLFQTFAPMTGTISAETANLTPLVTALGIDPALVPPGASGRLTGTLESSLEQISITSMAATIGDWPIRGEISFKLTEAGRVMGQLKLPSIHFGALAALALGPVSTAYDARGWSTVPFGKPVAPPLSGDLWIEAATGVLPGLGAVEQPRLVLRFAREAVGIEYAEMRLGPARITGDFGFKRLGVAAHLAAKLKLIGFNLARNWPDTLQGLVDGEVQLTGRGETLAKIAQTLAGTGSLTLNNAVLSGFDPAALPRLIARPAPEAASNEAGTVIRTLETELARAPLDMGDRPLGLVVIDGTARLSSKPVEAGGVRIEPTGTIDLARMTADLRLQVSAPAPAGWIGVPPQVTAQWRGALGSLQRALNVDSLVNGLLAITLQGDLERAQMLDQDARERAFFNRRRRAMEEERRAAEEQRRAQEEAETLRIEAERLVERTRIQEQERIRREKDEADAAERAARSLFAVPPAPVLAPPRAVAPARPATPVAPPLNLLPPTQPPG